MFSFKFSPHITIEGLGVNDEDWTDSEEARVRFIEAPGVLAAAVGDVETEPIGVIVEEIPQVADIAPAFLLRIRQPAGGGGLEWIPWTYCHRILSSVRCGTWSVSLSGSDLDSFALAVEAVLRAVRLTFDLIAV